MSQLASQSDEAPDFNEIGLERLLFEVYMFDFVLVEFVAKHEMIAYFARTSFKIIRYDHISSSKTKLINFIGFFTTALRGQASVLISFLIMAEARHCVKAEIIRQIEQETGTVASIFLLNSPAFVTVGAQYLRAHFHDQNARILLRVRHRLKRDQELSG